MASGKDDKRVGFLLERTTRIVKLCFTKAFSQLEVDITPEQWVVLDTLMQEGPMSQVDIAQIIFKNTPTVSRLIDKLESKGFLNRIPSQEDRRATIISITSQGKELVKKCLPEVERLRSLSLEGLDKDEFQHFTRVIDKVFKNMQSY